MAKKPATKAEETPAQQPGQKKMSFVTLKHWATGTINQTQEPLLMVETVEGVHIGIRISGQSARELGKALQVLGEKQPAMGEKAN